MPQTNTNDRSPRDLSVPETMKIAALLAELMPPGAEIGSGAEPIELPSNSSDSILDAQGSVLDSPALEMEDLDELDHAEVDENTVTKPIASFAETNGTKPTPAVMPEPVPAPAPAPAHPVASKSAPLDPELIPLGSLTVAGYFSLVNWKNDPKRVRHPRRADYGLDQQTLAQASRNPFYVVGQPRRPEDRSVSEVMAEIVWE